MKRFSTLILAAMVGCAFLATSVPAQAKTAHAHDTAKKKKKKKKKHSTASHTSHAKHQKVAKSSGRTDRAPASSSTGYKRASVYMKKHS